MDLPGKSSACSKSHEGKVERTSRMLAGEEDCADKQNYWQLYREKYHRLGITTKSTTIDAPNVVQKMTFRDYPGVTSVQTHADTVGSRSHCGYDERRRSRGGTVQLPLPHSNLMSYSSEACDDYQLDALSTPAISHSLSSADFGDIQRAEQGGLGVGNARFGCSDDDATSMTSTPRTSSLLNDPMLRKHLARAMGVDASSNALEGEINRRVGSVHVAPALIDNEPAELISDNTDAGAVIQQVELSSVLGTNVGIVRKTKCMVAQDLTVEPSGIINSNCGVGAEGADALSSQSEIRRTLSCSRTRSTQMIGPRREVGVCWTDVTHQSVETDSSETPDILQKHVISPPQEPSSSSMPHLWHSAAKDTSQSVDCIKASEGCKNITESSDKKVHSSSVSVLPVSQVMTKKQLLPRRTNSVKSPPTATNTRERAGFHMPSFREYKQSRKCKSTSDDVLSECIVSATVPECGSTESAGVSSDAVLTEAEHVSCTVNSAEKQVEETKCIYKARHRKRSVKIGDESMCAQSDKQLMFRTQKTTCARDETPAVLSLETALDTTSVCVVSPVSPLLVSSLSVSSVSSEHGGNVAFAKEAQKPQTPLEPCPTELNTPVAPPRRNRKLKVQLKVSTDAEPSGVRDSVCVDCIAARKSSTTSHRDETFTSSRCRLHRSEGSRPEVIIFNLLCFTTDAR